uniref:Transmembrane protein n=1 Tax=Kalanchoe fedtschenkoi TaxID=63787 RepID=A0A7N0V508_KALFE
MAIIGDALRQAFMPKHEYESLRDEDRVWLKLQRPMLSCFLALIVAAIVVSVYICLIIVFPDDVERRPFCGGGLRLQPLPVGASRDPDQFRGVFILTDQETVDYFWVVVFLPSLVVFSLSVMYLVAGVAVAYSAPARSRWLFVVKNNYCASRRGSVRCLSILNIVFSIIYALLAVFLGSSLLTLGSRCSVPLFWCYEVVSWGLVILFGGTAFFLRRKAAQILDEYSSPSSRNAGLELLETNSDVVITPEVERRVHESFQLWMGSSLPSSDDEDEPDEYAEAPHSNTNSSIQERV